MLHLVAIKGVHLRKQHRQRAARPGRRWLIISIGKMAFTHSVEPQVSGTDHGFDWQEWQVSSVLMGSLRKQAIEINI